MPTTPTGLGENNIAIPKFFNGKISNKAAIRVSFTNADVGVMHFIERSPNGGTGWVKCGTSTFASDRTIVAGNVPLGANSYFRIRSQGSGGYSAYSANLGPMMMPALPVSNSGLSEAEDIEFITLTSYSVKIGWLDNNSAEAGWVAEFTLGTKVITIEVPPLITEYTFDLSKLFPGVSVASQVFSFRMAAIGGLSKATKPIPFISDWTGANSFQLAAPSIRIQSPAKANGEVGSEFSYVGTTNTPASSWELVGGDTLPAGLTLDDETGIISGTPTAVITKTVRLKANNAVPTSDTITITFTIVASRIRFTSPSSAIAPLNKSFSVPISAAPAGCVFVASVLPDWLELRTATSGAVTLNGTPDTAGEYEAQIDATIGTSRNSFTLSIVVPPVALITPTNLNAALGQNYKVSIVAQPSGCTFSADGLPAWLTLDADGTLHGTPLALGSADFDITASANEEEGDSKTYTIVVGPLFTMDSDPNNVVFGEVSKGLIEHVAFKGNGLVLEWVMTGNPEGIEIWNMLPSVGQPYYGQFAEDLRVRGIRGTPTKAGTFKVVLNVSVMLGYDYAVYSKEFTMRITGGLYLAWLHKDPTLYDLQVPQRGDAASRVVRSYYGIEAKAATTVSEEVGDTTITSSTPAVEGNLLTLKHGDNSPSLALVILDDVRPLTGESNVRLTIREADAEDGDYLFNVAGISTAIGTNHYWLVAFPVVSDALEEALKGDSLGSLKVFGEISWTFAGQNFTSPTFPVTILEDVNVG